MNLSKLASSFFLGAALTAATFGQTSTPAASTSSGLGIGFSYDYFSFKQNFVGFNTIQGFWGANLFYADPGKLTWKRDGGTVTLSGSKWNLDGTYLQGKKTLLLPNEFRAANGTVLGRFEDQVKLDDTIYDLRLRYNIFRNFYVAAGYYNQTTDQDYSWRLVTTPASAFSNAGATALNGSYTNEYVTIGLGLAQTMEVGAGWFLSFKEEVTILGGRAKGQSGLGSTAASGATPTPGSVQGSSDAIWGARGSLSTRLSWVVNPTVTLGLEGGGEYRTFFESASLSYNARTSYGWLGRAAIKFNF